MKETSSVDGRRLLVLRSDDSFNDAYQTTDEGDLNGYRGLGFETAFAVIVSVLLLNVALLVRIKYGNAVITHLTTAPYILALFISTVMLAENVTYLLFSDTFYNQDHTTFLVDVSVNWYSRVFLRALIMVKYGAVFWFILSRAFEHQILHQFVLFQQLYKVESLDVVRDSYQRQEKAAKKVYKAVVVALWTPIVALYTLPFVTSQDYLANQTWASLFYALAMTVVMSVYSMTSMALMRAIYKYHRHEFKRHIRSMLVLFLATEVCLVALFYN